jgi:hypothetical protein
MVCKLFRDHSKRILAGILASSCATSALAWAPPVIKKFNTEPASFESAPIPGDALDDGAAAPDAVPLPGAEATATDATAPRTLPSAANNQQATPPHSKAFSPAARHART